MGKVDNKYLAAFMLLSVVPAFYVWHSVWYSFFIVILAGVFVQDISKRGYDTKVLLAFLLFGGVYFIHIVRAGLNIFGAIEVLCLLPFFIAKKETVCGVYDAFLKVYALAMGIGIPIYILVIWIAIALPNTEIAPFNELKTLTYHLYPFLVTQDSFGMTLSPRFYGLFDEPGVVGTISAIFLLTEKFNLKKWENIIILLSGIFSLSLFFFVACVLYILIEAPLKIKVGVAILSTIVVYLLYDNELLYEVFFHRFNIVDGNLEGMNREHGDFNTYYEKFRHSSDYWYGLGAGVGARMNEGGSSYKQMIVNYGVIFFVIYLLCHYLYAFARIRGWRNILIFSIILLGTIYQRPFLGTPTLTFLMISAACVLGKNIQSHTVMANNNRTAT